MTYPTPISHPTIPPQPGASGLLPIHGDDFSQNPNATYEALRAQGPIAPVEIAPGMIGYIAVTYRAALYVLQGQPVRFSKDPKHWDHLRNGQIPPDSSALMMMMPRDNALWKDGEEHLRLRSAITAALDQVDTHAFAALVAVLADRLIDTFATAGKCDLVHQYADPLPKQATTAMFGCPEDIGQRIVAHVTALFDVAQDATEANRLLESACMDLVHLKRRRPQPDVASWLIHAGLTDAEMVQTIVLLIGAGSTPSSNLISNGLRKIITEDRFSGTLHTGVRAVADALDEVLWDIPPVSNYCPLYSIGEQWYEGTHIAPGYPILVSFAAANNDPLISRSGRTGNRGHLAFSAGAHACPGPARGLARIIAEAALERALDRLAHLTLNIPPSELRIRPATFHTGLTALPVNFQPTSTLQSNRR